MERQRTQEVDEQDYPVAVRIVPGFMIMAVVENQTPPLLPTANLVCHANSAAAIGFGDHQPQVIAKQSFIRPSMRQDVGLRSKNGEHRHFQSGNFLDDSCRFRAAVTISLDLVAEAEKEKALPSLSLRYGALFGGYVLQVWDLFLVSQQNIRFFADRAPIRFHSFHPRKRLCVEERAVAAGTLGNLRLHPGRQLECVHLPLPPLTAF